MKKNEIVEILEQIAILLELKGENPFKVRAYQNGARALETLSEPFETVVEEGRLGEVPGIGDALVKKIDTLLETGRLDYYENLKASVPAGLIQMMEIPGLGAKKIKALHDKLGVESIDALAQACRDGKVAGLPGFGAKTQTKILEGIQHREAYSKRHLWWDAFAIAEPILTGLRGLKEVERAEHAGSLRRNLETVGDLDFIVASEQPGPVMDWFTEQEGVGEVTGKGETKASIRLESGLQADLRVVPAVQFACALHHFTGSKEHNVQMRHRALERGYSLSEWGVTATDDPEKPVKTFASEEALFSFFGLDYIPPELREGLGEIEAAETHNLPKLVEFGSLKGAFHNHTTASDGHNSLEEMVAAAEARGWEYLGIADHSKASFQANGLSEERVRAQLNEIRALNRSGRFKTHVFAGIECDILPDGRLDLSDEILHELDYVVVSVHSSFSLSEDEMTARIVRAIEHPATTMLGHMTGRLLLARESYQVNTERIVDAAAANGVIIEINAHPKRLDMDWRHWRRATEKGVITSINPDAHDTDGLKYVEAGLRIARKGWLGEEHVFNCRALSSVREYLSKRRDRKI